MNSLKGQKRQKKTPGGKVYQNLNNYIMAHPRSKQSKTRSRKRRTHYKLDTPNVSSCGNCGEAILFHHVCPECGYYKGKKAIDKDVVV